MKVFKFGGASVKDAGAVENLVSILNRYPEDRLVVVVSAMGKTTNALEHICREYYFQDREVEGLIEELRIFHHQIVEELFGPEVTAPMELVDERLELLRNKLIKFKRAEASYDFIYDQVVSEGEMMSTLIVDAYMNLRKLKSVWIDATSVIHTDDNYREARINWELTASHCEQVFDFDRSRIFITQGFIGKGAGGYVTTLGREGSDFTGAIIANALEADELIIWKDVPGLLNADPKYFANTRKLQNISYHEAVELAYYGATVIHPKTIKPLQNKGIPLYVNSFLDPTRQGSLIDENVDRDGMIPSYIFKTKQILISISTRDYSFIVEENLSEIFDLFARHKVKINLMQNSALSFSVCVDDKEDRVPDLVAALQVNYKVLYNKGVELMTVRHYDQNTLDLLVADKAILVEQKSRHTARLVMKHLYA